MLDPPSGMIFLESCGSSFLVCPFHGIASSTWSLCYLTAISLVRVGNTTEEFFLKWCYINVRLQLHVKGILCTFSYFLWRHVRLHLVYFYLYKQLMHMKNVNKTTDLFYVWQDFGAYVNMFPSVCSVSSLPVANGHISHSSKKYGILNYIYIHIQPKLHQHWPCSLSSCAFVWLFRFQMFHICTSIGVFVRLYVCCCHVTVMYVCKCALVHTHRYSDRYVVYIHHTLVKWIITAQILTKQGTWIAYIIQPLSCIHSLCSFSPLCSNWSR